MNSLAPRADDLPPPVPSNEKKNLEVKFSIMNLEI